MIINPLIISLFLTIVFGIPFHNKISKVSDNEHDIIINEKKHRIIALGFITCACILVLNIMILMTQFAIGAMILAIIVFLVVIAIIS